jgi:2-polyprenyl-6-hydroxyphenyl methylase/3-demethylubiquinone-9 3-methyltransferase
MAASPTQFYERFAPQFDSEMNRYEVEKRLRLIFDDVLGQADLHERRLLDAGCGTGLFSQAAARRGARVTSLDVGPKLLAEVAKKCESELVVGDTTALPFDDGSFELIISTEVIEHTVDPRVAARELARVLAPGGTLLITTPNRVWHFSIRLANAMRLRPYHGLENWVTWRQLRDWVTEDGLNVVDHRGFNAFPFIHPVVYPMVDTLDGVGRRWVGRLMINQLVHAMKPTR